MNSLARLVAIRLALGLLSLFVLSILIFIGVDALPGDLAESILGQEATPETVSALRKELKLDLPPHVRYLDWIRDFSHGNAGISLINRRPVSKLIGWRIENSLFLAGVTTAVAVPLSILLGILAALHRNSLFDRFVSISTLSAISFPEYFIAYILVALFSVKFQLFPSMSNITSDMSLFRKLYDIFLPCLTLTMVTAAHMMRMTRASIISLLGSPYIEMALLKGLKRSRIIVHHALPNALSPIIIVVALNMAYLIVGVVIVEVVFVYPGLGQLMVDAVSMRDFPVVQACGLIFASAFMLLNLIADILSIITNPRLRNPR